MTFRTRVDAWYYLLTFGSPLAVFLLAGPALREDGASGMTMLFLISAVALGLPLWLLLTTEYRVDDAELVVRSGPFRWRIPLAEIESVTATRSPLSSPALSLHRLRIRYGKGRSLLVSPRDREGFLRATGHAAVDQ